MAFNEMSEVERALQALARVRTPIVYDAIEKMHLRPRTEGYSDASIRCLTPSLGPLVGYAMTGKITGNTEIREGEPTVPWREVWTYVQRSKGPSVMIVEDVDQPPRRACAWGDLAASIFLSLGCLGAITNGNVRDIDEVEKLGFHLHGDAPTVGHGYIRYTEIGTDVRVGGITIRHGDLLHADRHGVLVIPPAVVLSELVSLIGKFLASEKTVIDVARKDPPSLDDLVTAMRLHNSRFGHMG